MTIASWGVVNAQNTLINHGTILFAIAWGYWCLINGMRSRKSWQVSP
ncbi:MAG: hypothetical protein RID09_17205 [Coleofasciculus sp. G1-WW12-02]